MKYMKKLLIFSLIITIALPVCSQIKHRLEVDNINQIVANMSLGEKVSMCLGLGTFWEVTNNEQGLPGAAGGSKGISHLGILTVYFADGPLGLKISETRDFDSHRYSCTSVPVPLLLASSWDKDAVYQVGKIIGNECLEYGVGVLLAPSFNIERNPLCGRNHEYYSEDPYLSGTLAAAFVKGTQSEGVGTAIKHFVANNQETNRTQNDARISQQALREIYLKPFEIAVKESSPWTVMTSYNKVNGEYTSESKELIKSILRDEWGFKGMVMSDWNGGKDASKSISAGNDMLQPGNESQYNRIMSAVQSGELDKKELDASVTRILKMVVKTPAFNGFTNSNTPDLKPHAQIARQIAAESMILLKNDNTLPFQKVQNVALYGCTAYDVNAGGIGYKENSGPNYKVSLVEGFRNAGIIVDRELTKVYLNYLESDRLNVEKEAKEKGGESLLSKLIVVAHEVKEMEVPDSLIRRQVKMNDMAIIVLGHNAGEAVDRSASDFQLKKEEIELIKKVTEMYRTAGKKTIVVLNIPGPIETVSWKEMPDAILCAYQPGEQGGNSIADILTGKINPSGKLTVTFPVSLEDNPSTANFPIEGGKGISGLMAYVQESESTNKEPKVLKKNVDYTNYEEDIYVGYRFFDSFNMPVSYPFGYGLSYTTFSYDNAEISENSNGFEISLTVTNTGKVKGKEVVQVYVEAPKEAIEKPIHELKAFAKTKELNPGESHTLSMKMSYYDMASFDTKKSAWITAKGTYKLEIGASSRDIKIILEKRIAKEQMYKVEDLMNPKVKLNLLKQKK